MADETKTPPKVPSPSELLAKQQTGASEPTLPNTKGVGEKLTESAVGLTNAFVNLATGTSGLKDSLGALGSELGKYGKGGKIAASPLFAAQKTFEVGDVGRESYKKLAEAISASTGSIAGSFVETGENIDMFAKQLKVTGQETGQSFDMITSGVSRLMKASSDIASSQAAIGDATKKTAETFRTYSEVVKTSRNVGLELNESLDLSEQLFKQQGLTLENTSDHAESALGTMRMLNKAIEGTGVSIQAATRFVKENASAYEFLNWSSRKTSMTLGSVASFAKQNKDIFKSSEQGVELYGKALQGTAAVQQDFGKSMFYGLMSPEGQGKGGLQAMFDFQALEGPEAMQSIADTVQTLTGGSALMTHKEARESGDEQAQTAYMLRTQMLSKDYGISTGQAMKLQDAMSRFKLGDEGAGKEMQEIMDAADPAKIAEADKQYQKQLYTSSELGNRILSGIKADTQRMASRIQSKITPEEATGLFNKIEEAIGKFAPEEAKEVMSALKSGSAEKIEALTNKIKGAGNIPTELLGKMEEYKKKVESGDPEADKVYDEAKGQATGVPSTPAPSLPSADQTQIPQQAPASTAPATPTSAAPSATQPTQPTTTSPGLGQTKPTAGQTQLGASPKPSSSLQSTQKPTGEGLQGLKAIKGISIPELGMSSNIENELTYGATSQAAFASGGALEQNVAGTLAAGGSTENEYGFGMSKMGIMSNKQKGLGGEAIYKPEPGKVLQPPAESGLSTSVQTTPWTKVGEKVTSKQAAAPEMEAASAALVSKTKELLDAAPLGDTSQLGAEHKSALDQFNTFIEQMKGKGDINAASSVEGVNAVSSPHGIFAIQQAQASAQQQGKDDLAKALSKWEEVYTLGKDVQTAQDTQAGAATSKEVAYSKLTTETGGFNLSGMDIGTATAEDDPMKLSSKYVPPSKGDFLSVLSSTAAAPIPKTSTALPKPVLSSKEFPAAANIQVPQLDGGTAQAVILDKQKKEAAAQEAAKKSAATASTSSAAKPQQSQGAPLTAQVVLNVNGNALMEQLVQTQAFEKGVKTHVASDQASTYKNFGNKA